MIDFLINAHWFLSERFVYKLKFELLYLKFKDLKLLVSDIFL